MTSDPRDIRIAQLLKEVRDLNDKVALGEGRLKAREETLDRANATVDDQAAQIVDLTAKLQSSRPATGTEQHSLQDRIRKMQVIEESLRRSAERNEARVAQLVAAWPSDEIMPAEPMYFRNREGTGSSF
ncbi:MAG: hypothetical protein ACREJ1_04545 [Candidatus Methylomirabilales bacterium]